ncbi:MAG: hypothetical protein LBU95_05310, partial [Rikenellaceae bacterium]|nr:hypothetical protein [Rikenellaceae bacterium]
MATKKSSPLLDGPVTASDENSEVNAAVQETAKAPRKRAVKAVDESEATAGAPKKRTTKKAAEAPAGGEDAAEKPVKKPAAKKTAVKAAPVAQTPAAEAPETQAAESVDFSDEDAALAGDAPEFDLGEEHEHEAESAQPGEDL